MTRAIGRLATLAALLGACGPMEPPVGNDSGVVMDTGTTPVDSGPPPDVVLPPSDGGVLPTVAAPLFVRAITFNNMMVMLGTVAAVTDNAGTSAFFGSMGMRLLRWGALLASNAEITTWRAAATVPAVLGTGTWTIAVDAMGRVHRVRPDNLFEFVGDRYGVAGMSVRWVAHGGMNYVGFASDTHLSIADGMNTRRVMEGPFTAFGASNNFFAGVSTDRVKVLDAATGRLRTWNLPGATAVAVDAMGKLVVSAGPVLWVEGAEGVLQGVFRASAPITSMIRSGPRVWFVSGRELGTYAMGRVSMTSNTMLEMNSTLSPASMDEVWVLSRAAPRRYGADTGTQTPEAIWRATMQPVYATYCADCHFPGMGGQLPDLSTYMGWDANRMRIRNSVVNMMAPVMPPRGMFPMEQRTAVDMWLMMR